MVCGKEWVESLCRTETEGEAAAVFPVHLIFIKSGEVTVHLCLFLTTTGNIRSKLIEMSSRWRSVFSEVYMCMVSDVISISF